MEGRVWTFFAEDQYSKINVGSFMYVVRCLNKTTYFTATSKTSFFRTGKILLILADCFAAAGGKTKFVRVLG